MSKIQWMKSEKSNRKKLVYFGTE